MRGDGQASGPILTVEEEVRIYGASAGAALDCQWGGRRWNAQETEWPADVVPLGASEGSWLGEKRSRLLLVNRGVGRWTWGGQSSRYLDDE